jgi:hypothetical protein
MFRYRDPFMSYSIPNSGQPAGNQHIQGVLESTTGMEKEFTLIVGVV